MNRMDHHDLGQQTRVSSGATLRPSQVPFAIRLEAVAIRPIRLEATSHSTSFCRATRAVETADVQAWPGRSSGVRRRWRSSTAGTADGGEAWNVILLWIFDVL